MKVPISFLYCNLCAKQLENAAGRGESEQAEGTESARAADREAVCRRVKEKQKESPKVIGPYGNGLEAF